jgi:LmbE family N-acetylglucosaminyl deacetylase
MSPVRNWERIGASHPDHMAAAEATVQAIYPDARNQFAHPTLMLDEGLEEWVVAELWMFGSPTPNTFVDVTEHLPTKLAALRAHVSQTEHMDDLEGMIRTWMAAAAERGGLGAGRLAEMFHAVRTG